MPNEFSYTIIRPRDARKIEIAVAAFGLMNTPTDVHLRVEIGGLPLKIVASQFLSDENLQALKASNDHSHTIFTRPERV